jgi:hypothetical protein
MLAQDQKKRVDCMKRSNFETANIFLVSFDLIGKEMTMPSQAWKSPGTTRTRIDGRNFASGDQSGDLRGCFKFLMQL